MATIQVACAEPAKRGPSTLSRARALPPQSTREYVALSKRKDTSLTARTEATVLTDDFEEEAGVESKEEQAGDYSYRQRHTTTRGACSGCRAACVARSAARQLRRTHTTPAMRKITTTPTIRRRGAFEKLHATVRALTNETTSTPTDKRPTASTSSTLTIH